MPQLKGLQVIFAKREATEGTDPVPTAPDALQLAQPATLTWGAYQDNDQDEKDNLKLEPDAPLAPSFMWAELSFRLYARGKGSAYATTAGPETHAVLPIYGMQDTFAASQWSYDTISQLAAAGLLTSTFYMFKGLDTNVWVLHKLLAARGKTITLSAVAGQPAFIDCVVRGQYVEPTDTAIISPTYFTTIPPAFAAAASWQLGSFATGFVKRASVTLENTLQFRDNANLPPTTVRHAIVGRRMSFDVGVEAARVADYNPWNKWTSRTQEQLIITLGAGGSNNKITFTADRAQFTQEPVGYEDENGLVRFAAKGKLDPGGTNRFNWTYNT